MKDKNLEYLEDIWAKQNPFKSILAHALDTAAVANALLSEGIFQALLSDLCNWVLKSYTEDGMNSIKSLIIYLASIHDIGKISPFFIGKNDTQAVCAKLQSKEIIENYPDDMKIFRHECYSKIVATRIWKQENRFDFEKRSDGTIDNLAKILSLHHQGKGDKSKEIPEGEAQNLWWQQQEIFENIMYRMFQPPQVEINKKTGNVSIICMMILGVVILSDWLASSNAFADENLKKQENCSEYYLRMQEKADRLVKQSGLAKTILPQGETFSEMWTSIPKEKMRPLQAAIEEIMLEKTKPFVTIIEAPMGEGKTEAGIYAACRMGEYYRKKGFYVALPTAATANQMHERISRMIEQQFPEKEVRLLHSLAWLTDDITKDKQNFISEDQIYASEWTKPLRRGLLEGFSVGTIDQVLMAALCVKYGVLRLLAIQNKVLILDEVHAYDAYMQDILLKLLCWCREMNVPVVMLSATLATKTKEKLLEVYEADYQGKEVYPAITTIFQDGVCKVTPIKGVSCKKEISIQTEKILDNIEVICDSAVSLVKEGGCLCILVNTVRKAQEIYNLIKEKKSEDLKLFLFHAKFSEGRKKKIEKEVVHIFGPEKSERPQKAIVIATQVVEQSLDVDFDYMITEIAPIDLLLQRFGRVFRHANTPRPAWCQSAKVMVIVPEDGSGYGASEFVYPPVLLNLTKKYLETHQKIVCPDSSTREKLTLIGCDNIKNQEAS